MVFSLFKIMLTISYTTNVTLYVICLLSVAKNVLNTTFELVNLGRPFLRCIRFKQWSSQSLTWNAQKPYN